MQQKHKTHAPRNDCKLTRELVEAFLAALGDGNPPFLAFAADRVGMRRGAVKEYMHAAEHDPNPHPLIIEFARRARKIRSEYVLLRMGEMISCDAKTAARAAQIQWLITRIERDELHINPNPGKESRAAPAVEPAKPAPAPQHDSEEAKSAAEDLATTEATN